MRVLPSQGSAGGPASGAWKGTFAPFSGKTISSDPPVLSEIGLLPSRPVIFQVAKKLRAQKKATTAVTMAKTANTATRISVTRSKERRRRTKRWVARSISRVLLLVQDLSYAVQGCKKHSIPALILSLRLHQPILGGGTGSASTGVVVHLSPSSISMTGISSTIGYLRVAVLADQPGILNDG